jgi:hypothetical protein
LGSLFLARERISISIENDVKGDVGKAQKKGVRPIRLKGFFVIKVKLKGVKYHHLNFSIIDFKRNAVLNNQT